MSGGPRFRDVGLDPDSGAQTWECLWPWDEGYEALAETPDGGVQTERGEP